MKNIKDTMKAIDNKVVSSKWTPRVLAGVGAVSAFAGNAFSTFADEPANAIVVPDTSGLANTLGESAMTAVTNGYTAAIPVMCFALGIGIIIRKIMGAARHC